MAECEREDQEANLFALLLLMPSRFIKDDLMGGIDLAGPKNKKEKTILEMMAKKYDVTMEMLLERIIIFRTHGF